MAGTFLPPFFFIYKHRIRRTAAVNHPFHFSGSISFSRHGFLPYLKWLEMYNKQCPEKIFHFKNFFYFPQGAEQR